MKWKKMFTLFTVLLISGVAVADRPLEKTEILQIFENLTDQPQNTWIASGTIQANHEEYQAPKNTNEELIQAKISEEIQNYLDKPDKVELSEELQQRTIEAIPFNVRYKLSNEQTMKSNVVVRYDGERFFWKTEVDSRTDSVQPGPTLQDNPCLEDFNHYWNDNRIFAWDGEKYVLYFRPGNQATIENSPSAVNGPLTAGIIPWGYGRYSYENLANAQSSAEYVENDSQNEIHLTINQDNIEESFILDPAKAYAAKSYSKTTDNAITISTYEDYKSVGNRWCPGRIVIKNYDADTSKLSRTDTWNIESINTNPLGDDSFKVEFDYDAFIEDFRFGEEPLQYRYSPPEYPSDTSVNTDELLSMKLMYNFFENKQNLDCATTAVKYVTAKLGKDISLKTISQNLEKKENGVTLFSLEQFAKNNGFHTQAIKTNIETLQDLSKYQAIVHLAKTNHFAVLGEINNGYVRIVDLTNDKFYYRKSIDDFERIWDGTALIISNEPIKANRAFAMLPAAQSRKIFGAASSQACNTKIQSSSSTGCNFVIGGCSNHYVYYTRYKCGSGSGTCTNNTLPTGKTETCIEDPNNLGSCVGLGNWTSFGSISACS